MTIAPYGSWASPISVEALTLGLDRAVGRADRRRPAVLAGVAPRPGRPHQLWRRPLDDGPAVEVTPGSAYVRNRVHEYGGGEYAVRGRRGRLLRAQRRPDLPDRRRRGPSRSPRPARSATAISGCIPTVAWCWPYARTTPAEASRSTRSSRSTWPATTPTGGTVLCSGADFYSTPELSARRPAGLDPVGPPEHALGRRGDHGRKPRAGSAVRDAVVVAGGAENRPCSRAGAPTTCSSSRTGATGGTSTAGLTAARRRCIRRTPSLPSRNGSWGRRRTRSSTMIACCARSTGPASSSSRS